MSKLPFKFKKPEPQHEPRLKLAVINLGQDGQLLLELRDQPIDLQHLLERGQ